MEAYLVDNHLMPDVEAGMVLKGTLLEDPAEEDKCVIDHWEGKVLEGMHLNLEDM